MVTNSNANCETDLQALTSTRWMLCGHASSHCVSNGESVSVSGTKKPSPNPADPYLVQPRRPSKSDPWSVKTSWL